MNREWKRIIVENETTRYEVSNDGFVRNIERLHYKNGGIFTAQIGKKGYASVNLTLENGKKRMYVHRLVATAFLTKQEGLDMVNHKDGNKENNRVENLEWTDAKGNIRHAFENNLISTSRKVIVYTSNGDFVGVEDSISSAKENYSAKNVFAVLKGVQQTSGGYHFRYYEDEDYPKKITIPSPKTNAGVSHAVCVYDLSGKMIDEVSSIAKCAEKYKIPKSTLLRRVDSQTYHNDLLFIRKKI